MTTREQLEDFRAFANDQLDQGGEDWTLDELYSLWRSQNPTPEELADSVAAVKAAYQELLAGDPGVPARAALREDLQRRGLSIDE